MLVTMLAGRSGDLRWRCRSRRLAGIGDENPRDEKARNQCPEYDSAKARGYDIAAADGGAVAAFCISC